VLGTPTLADNNLIHKLVPFFTGQLVSTSPHGEFERHARAQRRFFEKQRAVTAFKRRGKTRARFVSHLS
jgi:hypothetical protein